MRNPQTPTDMRTEAQRLRAYADRLTEEANRAADNAPGAYVTGGSGRSRAQNKRTERAMEKTIDNAMKAVAALKRAGRLEAIAADIEAGRPAKRRLARYRAREKEIAHGRAQRKAMREGELKDRLGVYAFPTGYVYADKAVEINGDYRRLGFLSFTTLIFEIDKGCPAYWREYLIGYAHVTQIAAGERVQISTCGQTSFLGTSGPERLRGRFFTVPDDETIWEAAGCTTWEVVATPFGQNERCLWLTPDEARQHILAFEETLITNRYGIDQDWPIVLAAGRTYPRLKYVEERVKE